jgi:hypothetical protein
MLERYDEHRDVFCWEVQAVVRSEPRGSSTSLRNGWFFVRLEAVVVADSIRSCGVAVHV